MREFSKEEVSAIREMIASPGWAYVVERFSEIVKGFDADLILQADNMAREDFDKLIHIREYKKAYIEAVSLPVRIVEIHEQNQMQDPTPDL